MLQLYPWFGSCAFFLIWIITAFCGYPLVKRLFDRELLMRPGIMAWLLALTSAAGSVVAGTLWIYCSWGFGVNSTLTGIFLLLWVGLGLFGFYTYCSDRFWLEAVSVTNLVNCIALLVIVGPFLALMWLGVMTPDLGIDDYHYHVSIIRLWFQEGSLAGANMHSHSYFPLLGSAVAGIFKPLFGLQAAKYVQLSYMITVVVLLYGAVRVLTGRAGLAIVAALFFCVLPLNFFQAFLAMSDRGLACMVVGALSLFLMPGFSGLWRLVLLSILLGGAGTMKHHGLFVAAAAAAVAILQVICSKKDARLSGIRHLLLAGITAVLVLMPWYGRSYLETGNPMYPVWNPANSANLEANQKVTWNLFRKQYEPSYLQALQGTFYRDIKTGAHYSNTPVLWLLLPPFLVGLFRYRRHLPPGWQALGGALVIYFIISLTLGLTRYRSLIYTVQPALILLFILGFAAAYQRRRGSVFLSLFAFLFVLLQAPWLGYYAKRGIAFDFGACPEIEYRTKYHRYQGDDLLFSEYLKDNDRVALLDTMGTLSVRGRIYLVKRVEMHQAFYTTSSSLPHAEPYLGSGRRVLDWLENNDMTALIIPYEGQFKVEVDPDLLLRDAASMTEKKFTVIKGKTALLAYRR